MTTTRTRPAPDSFVRRRQAVARRRWWPWVAVALCLALVAGATWAVGWSSLLTAREVRVVGLDTLRAADVRRQAAVPEGLPLARLDTSAVADRVALMPRVRDVDVARSWPHGVVVTVRERRPVAVVRERGDVRALDAEGVLFRSFAKVPAGLPVVELESGGEAGGGSRVRQDALREVARVVGSLDPRIARRVSRVRAASMDAITLVLRSGAQVRWGSAEQSAAKARVLEPLLRIDARVYDVSAPARPTTRR